MLRNIVLYSTFQEEILISRKYFTLVIYVSINSIISFLKLGVYEKLRKKKRILLKWKNSILINDIIFHDSESCMKIHQKSFHIYTLSDRQSAFFLSHVTPDIVDVFVLGGVLLLFRLTARACVSSASHFAVSSNFLGWKHPIIKNPHSICLMTFMVSVNKQLPT